MISIDADNFFFDFDGTLCESESDIKAAWRATFAELGIEAPLFESRFRTGPTLEELSRRVFPDANESWRETFRRAFKRRYDHSDFPDTVPYPGMDGFLRRLHASGKRLFVATNKRKAAVESLLRKLGWSDLFDAVYHSELLPAGGSGGKAWMLTNAVNTFKLSPERSAMVGDTAEDVAAGKKCGFVTVAVNWGYGDPGELAAAGPDVILKPEDLL